MDISEFVRIKEARNVTSMVDTIYTIGDYLILDFTDVRIPEDVRLRAFTEMFSDIGKKNKPSRNANK